MTQQLTSDQADAVVDLEKVLTMTPLDVLAGDAVNYMRGNFLQPSGIDPEGKWKMPRLEASAQVRVCEMIQHYFQKMLEALREHNFSRLKVLYEQMLQQMTESQDLPKFCKRNASMHTMEEDGLAQVCTSIGVDIYFLAED